jgi:hypothetical protein
MLIGTVEACPCTSSDEFLVVHLRSTIQAVSVNSGRALDPSRRPARLVALRTGTDFGSSGGTFEHHSWRCIPVLIGSAEIISSSISCAEAFRIPPTAARIPQEVEVLSTGSLGSPTELSPYASGDLDGVSVPGNNLEDPSVSGPNVVAASNRAADTKGLEARLAHVRFGFGTFMIAP